MFPFNFFGPVGGVIPAAADVRNGTSVGNGAGTLDLPAVTDVKSGVVFDNTTKTGTYAGGGASHLNVGGGVTF